MNDTPPPIPPENPTGFDGPSPEYAAYHRGAAFEGQALPPGGGSAHLKDLADAYFGLNWSFLGVILSYIAAIVLMALVMSAIAPSSAAQQNSDDDGMMFLGVMAGMVAFCAVTFGACIYKPIAAFARAKRYHKWLTWFIFLVLVMTIGIFAFVIAQMLALQDMKPYGIKGGCSGIRKRTVMERIEQLRAQGL